MHAPFPNRNGKQKFFKKKKTDSNIVRKYGLKKLQFWFFGNDLLKLEFSEVNLYCFISFYMA